MALLQGYLAGIRRLTLHEVPVPEPGPGEVVVRVERALTCGTDLKTFRRGHARLPVPGPFGHEASGVVHAVGPGVERFRPGDAVMWVPTAPCGECGPCRSGRENLCRRLFEPGRIALGAYAEYLRLPAPVVARHLFPKPDHLSFERAAFLEPLSCIVRGWHRLGRPREVVVMGVGTIGLLHIMTARALGVERIVAVGRRPQGLAVARRAGATETIEGDAQKLAGTIRDAFGGDGPEAVIEATGRAEGWQAAAEWVRPGGRVLLFGGLAGGTWVHFEAYRIHYEEVDLIGSFHYTPRDVREAYDLLVRGRLPVEELISARRPLRDLPDVFLELDRGQAIKVALCPHGAPGEDGPAEPGGPAGRQYGDRGLRYGGSAGGPGRLADRSHLPGAGPASAGDEPAAAREPAADGPEDPGATGRPGGAGGPV